MREGTGRILMLIYLHEYNKRDEYSIRRQLRRTQLYVGFVIHVIVDVIQS